MQTIPAKPKAIPESLHQGPVAGQGLMDAKEFGEIERELAAFEAQREQAIVSSREIITLSKQIIYAVHRNDLKKAQSLLPVIKEKVSTLPTGSVDTDMPLVARQEYVEAGAYLHFMLNGTLATRKDLGVQWPEYLAGLCDLTGELVRKAVKDVIEGQLEHACRIHQLVDGIYGAFLQFDLRGGELRKKSDAVRWNLKKLEDVMYDVAMQRRAGKKAQGES